MKRTLSLLITGAAGWIGSRVARVAEREGEGGIPVFLTDVAPQPSLAFPFLQGDLCDPEFAGKVLDWATPGAILHLAGTNHNAPRELHWLLNLGGTANLLEACAASRWRGHFIQLGSAAEYGRKSHVTHYSESTPCSPRGAYAVSKYLQFRCLSAFGDAGWRWIHLRLFNPIGPGMRPHLMLGRLIGQVSAMRDASGPIRAELWTPHPVRDYVSVEDVAGILLRAAREQWDDEILNIGTGRGWSVAEVVAALSCAAGREIQVTYTKPEMGSDDVVVADTTRLQRRLGDAFAFSDLHSTLREMWSALTSS